MTAGLTGSAVFFVMGKITVGYKVTEVIENVPPKEYNIVIWFNGA